MLRRSLTVLHPAVEYARYPERIGRSERAPARTRAPWRGARGHHRCAGVRRVGFLLTNRDIKSKTLVTRALCRLYAEEASEGGARSARRGSKRAAAGPRVRVGHGHRGIPQGSAGGQIASGPLPGARRRQHTRRTFSPSLHRFIFLSIEPPLPDLLADRPIPSVDLSPLPSPLLAVASASSMLKPPPSVEALAAIVRSIRAAIFLVSSYEVPNGGR